jgi:hydroxymethylbilane synthase
MGPTPRIGTSSVRRIAQLKRIFADAMFEPIRGNLDTRLRKLDERKYDSLILAAAGLQRLGFGSRISGWLSVSECVPAPGQGALAIEVRQDDEAVAREVRRVDRADERARLAAERALVAALGGGCQVPIGALASTGPDRSLLLESVVISLDGSVALRARERGLLAEPEALGQRVAARLIGEGAGEILAAVRGNRPS